MADNPYIRMGFSEINKFIEKGLDLTQFEKRFKCKAFILSR